MKFLPSASSAALAPTPSTAEILTGDAALDSDGDAVASQDTAELARQARVAKLRREQAREAQPSAADFIPLSSSGHRSVSTAHGRVGTSPAHRISLTLPPSPLLGKDPAPRSRTTYTPAGCPSRMRPRLPMPARSAAKSLRLAALYGSPNIRALTCGN
jgi:hypothetical protein